MKPERVLTAAFLSVLAAVFATLILRLPWFILFASASFLALVSIWLMMKPPGATQISRRDSLTSALLGVEVAIWSLAMTLDGPMARLDIRWMLLLSSPVIVALVVVVFYPEKKKEKEKPKAE